MGSAVVKTLDSHRQDAAYTLIMNKMLDTDSDRPRMDLSRLKLYTCPAVLDKLAAIVDLNLSHNNIKTLPASFGVLACLEILQLDHNRIEFIPKSIGDLQRLRVCSLNRNRCTALPMEMKNNGNLQHLYVDRNDLTTLPEDLPKNLISLSCNRNHIELLPDTITNLKALQFLDCSNNRISELSHTMARMTRLQRFNMADNQLIQLNTEPEGMYGMPSLTSLNLRGTSLLFLPEELGLLDTLTQLDISHNRTLEKLTPELGELCDLETLSLNNCALRKLPEGLDDYTTNLRALDLSYNQLARVHPCVGGILTLRTLWLTKNRLVTLPEALTCLTNLTALYIDENIMTDLPESMGNLCSLKILSMRYNRLTALPDSMGRCSKLSELHLKNNKNITHFPESYIELKSLKAMSLDVGLLGSFSVELLGWVTNLQE
jgi:Leucine-rich repeat (LRR) protein